MSPGVVAALLLLMTLMGFGLRVYRLDAPSFWLDELYSIQWSKAYTQGDLGARPLAYLPTVVGLWMQGVDFAALDSGQPHKWRGLGVNEWSGRIPSALIGAASLLLLGLVVWRTFNARVALVCVLLLMCAPWHVWSSQIVRFYVLQFLAYNLSFLFYVNATRNHRKFSFVLAGVCLLCAFFTQLTSMMIVMVFGLDWLLNLKAKQPVRWGKTGWLSLVMAVVVGMLWWYFDFAKEPTAFTQFKGSDQSVFRLLFGLPYMIVVSLAAFAIVAGFWLFKIERRLAILLAVGVVVPIAAMFGFKLIDYDVHIRYLMVSMFVWLLLISFGLVEIFRIIKPQAGVMLALSPLVVLLAAEGLALHSYYTGGFGYRMRWRDAFEYVKENALAEDVVLVRPLNSLYALYYLEHDRIEEWRWFNTDQRLIHLDKPAWIVMRPNIHEDLYDRGLFESRSQLKKYFATRILQPASVIEVFWTPSTPTDNKQEKPDD